MIKSSISELSVEKPSEYPYLGIYKDKTFTVLFTHTGAGMVVHSSCSDWTVGCYSDGWKMSNFEKFDGVIELKNL